MRLCVMALLGMALAFGTWAAETAASVANEAQVAALVKDLSSEEFQTREAADKALLALGRAAETPIRKALETASDAESRNRLQRILDTIAVPLELTAEVVGEAQAGKPVKFKVVIKNVGNREVTAVPCLDGSTSDMRYPKFSRSVTPASTKPTATFARCGNCNGLRDADIVALKSGETLDVLGEKGFGTRLAEWVPEKEGTYTLIFTCDYAQQDAKLWNGPIERRSALSANLEAMLARVPKVKLTAKVEVTVKP